jgi:virulence-associated protein VapD
MRKYSKLLARVLSGRADSNIDFDDLRRLVEHLGFAERVRGSHYVFVRQGIRDMINLQREGRLAKPYQVRQVRAVITAHGLTVDEEE